MFFIKKAFLVFFSSIYTFSSLGNYGQFTFQQVQAAAPEKKVNIVAIFVDTAIYDGIKEKLDRYTNTYIPKHASDTKTLVMPINPTGFKAQDVQRILENLYFE